MSQEMQNSSKNSNLLVQFSLWCIKKIYRKYLKVWKARKDSKKKRITICSYHPHCSEYGILALEKHGFFKGWIKIMNRVKKCNKYQHLESCIDYP